MKKFITTGLLAVAIIGGAVQVQAEEAGTAMEGVKTEHHISIAKGFKKLGRETGIYRFFNPQTKEEKQEAYKTALVKTVQAEIAAGHFDGVYDVIEEAEIHGVEAPIIEALKVQYAAALEQGYEEKALLPEGAGQAVMILVGLGLIYLAIARKFEPLLLLPIGFGAILTNIPMAGISAGPIPGQPGGFLYYFYTVGVESGVFPLLIFMGVGAMTDFGPLLANPKTALLGAAAQFGIFIALLGAMAMGGLFTIEDAAAIGIIGGADGPTAIFLASRLSPNLLGAIAVAAYSYMALVPIIQPPIMKLFTTKAERAIEMKQLRHVYAAAEVFTIAWRRRTEMPSGDQARPWLFGVAYRVLSHQWRGSSRRSRLTTRLSSFRPLPQEGPDSQVVQHRDYELVRSAAARLDPLDQEVLRLVMWEELSHEQVAAMIGSTVPAAKQRFHRAKGRLAREFKRLGGTANPIAREEGGS